MRHNLPHLRCGQRSKFRTCDLISNNTSYFLENMEPANNLNEKFRKRFIARNLATAVEPLRIWASQRQARATK